MRQAVRQSDLGEVGKLAHGIRGGALNCGGMRLAELCAALEEAARGDLLADSGPTLASLEAEFATVVRALHGLQQGAPMGSETGT